MAASLKDPGSIPGGGPKRFHDSFNYVFYIVGECISCAADTHLASDLTSQKMIRIFEYSNIRRTITEYDFDTNEYLNIFVSRK